MNLHRAYEQISDADAALTLLKEGNRRFVANEMCSKEDYPVIRRALTMGQTPFAIVLCCSDSRVSPEIFFDQKLGDIFVIRNAGNVIDDAVLGSVEYGAEHLGSPLVVVIGHTNCGAVTAAVMGGEMSAHVETIVKKIRPAVKSDKVNEAAAQNALASAAALSENEIIQHLGTRVVAGLYDIGTGEVKWL